MSGWYIPVLIGAIMLLWVAAGRLEWLPPSKLVEKISSWRRLSREQKAREVFVLNFEAREFTTGDMEKEVYIIRKSRKGTAGSIVMNVGVESPKQVFSDAEREKAKQRLERRFPGLTVNFVAGEQEPQGKQS